MRSVKKLGMFEAQSTGSFIKAGDDQYFVPYKGKPPGKESTDWNLVRSAITKSLKPLLTYSAAKSPEGPFGLSRFSSLRYYPYAEFVYVTPLMSKLKNILPFGFGNGGNTEIIICVWHWDEWFYIRSVTTITTPDGKFKFAEKFRADGVAGVARLFTRTKEWITECMAQRGPTRSGITGIIVSAK